MHAVTVVPLAPFVLRRNVSDTRSSSSRQDPCKEVLDAH